MSRGKKERYQELCIQVPWLQLSYIGLGLGSMLELLDEEGWVQGPLENTGQGSAPKTHSLPGTQIPRGTPATSTPSGTVAIF